VINIAANAQNGYRTVVVQTGTQGLTRQLPGLRRRLRRLRTSGTYWPVGIAGPDLTITFTGANTQWNPGHRSRCEGTFGSGITVNTFQVTSPTTARANITITATHAQSSDLTSSPRRARPTIPARRKTPVQRGHRVPTLSIVDPGSGLQGAQNVTVNILGQYTTFDSTTTFSFGQGVTVNGPPTILGPTIATQSISIDQLAPLGGAASWPHTGCHAHRAGVGGAGFSVTPSLALISAITPNTALQGTPSRSSDRPEHALGFGDDLLSSATASSSPAPRSNSETDATLTLAIPASLKARPAPPLDRRRSRQHHQRLRGHRPARRCCSPPGQVRCRSRAASSSPSSARPPPGPRQPADGRLRPRHHAHQRQRDRQYHADRDGYVQPTTPVGYRNLTVSHRHAGAGLPNAVYVSPGPAVINSVVAGDRGRPGREPAGCADQRHQHQLGAGHHAADVPHVLVNSFTVNSPTSITANITVELDRTGRPVHRNRTPAARLRPVNVFTVSQTAA
jgi:hypothetical protein